MRIERKWAMPNKWTFTIKPIRELLKEELEYKDIVADLKGCILSESYY